MCGMESGTPAELLAQSLPVEHVGHVHFAILMYVQDTVNQRFSAYCTHALALQVAILVL